MVISPDKTEDAELVKQKHHPEDRRNANAFSHEEEEEEAAAVRLGLRKRKRPAGEAASKSGSRRLLEAGLAGPLPGLWVVHTGC